MSDARASENPEAPVAFNIAFWVWARIGLLSFGGPAAQIALMHRMIVEERGWLTEKQFLNALSFCMLLPGPEAMQLATYSGWRLYGVRGGLAAGLCFVIPGAIVIAALAWIYAVYGRTPLVGALFLGVKATVLIIVIEALLRVARKALTTPAHWVIAGLAFVAIFFFDMSYPLLILCVGLFGFIRGGGEVEEGAAAPVSAAGALRTICIWLVIWWAPVLAVDALTGQTILADLGYFFSKLAVVTFGGAYAVLAYMAQDVVNQFGWLGAGEMMDGLGLAETTPGPLILVTEFVGFLSAYKQGGLWLGLAGAALTLWVTFAPCFLWIFAGAPYIDWIGSQPRLRGALSAITAAVVGVILNLSIWFALHVLFQTVTAERAGPLTLWTPDLTSIDWRVIVLALISGYLLLARHRNILVVLAVSAALGLVLSQIG